MSALRIFITEAETGQILRDLAARHNLWGCLQIEGRYEWYDPVENAESIRRKGVSKAYLLPKTPGEQIDLSAETVQPRILGWIDVWPGRLLQKAEIRILTMTTIQAENRKGLSFKPANWLRDLKQKLDPVLSYGVVGLNIVSGGKYIYSDVGYSSEALKLFQQGVHWKQFEIGNTEYYPES